MNRDQRSSSNDPTDEPATAQSTQSASGLSSGRPADEDREEAIDPADSTRAALQTPRRYDQPIEADEDPVLPSDDSTLNTKI